MTNKQLGPTKANSPTRPQRRDDQRGHCATCGAGWREYGECEAPDCAWVVNQTEAAE